MADVKFNIAANAYQGANKMGGLPTPELNSAQAAGKPSFSDLVGEAAKSARSTGYENESLSAKAMADKVDLHELVTSVTNAELTLQTVVAIRDRVIGAYQDILKMPI